MSKLSKVILVFTTALNAFGLIALAIAFSGQLQRLVSVDQTFVRLLNETVQATNLSFAKDASGIVHVTTKQPELQAENLKESK